MKRRGMWLLFVTVVLSGLIAGCHTEKPLPEQDNNSQQTKYTYKSNYDPIETDISEEYEIQYIGMSCFSGNTLYFSAECEVFSENPEEVSQWETRVFAMDIDNKQIRMIPYETEPYPEGVEGYRYVSSIASAENGIVLTVNTETHSYDLPEDFNPETDNQWDYYQQGESYITVYHLNADGEVLSEPVRINSMDPETGSAIYSVKMDQEGNFYGSDWQNIYIFGKDGTLLHTLPSEYGNLVVWKGEQVGVISYGEEGQVLKLIDPATGEYSEEIDIGDRVWNLLGAMQPYEYLYDYNGVIYGHVAGQEDDEKVLDWLECDIDSNQLTDPLFLEDGRVFAFESKYDEKTQRNTYQLLSLERVDASTLPQKKELVMACFGLDWNLRSEIIQFNRSHEDVRIVVNDYSLYLDEETGMDGALMKLNTEIMSGVVPDLFHGSGIPIQKYAEQGLLQDLWPLIDQDPELSREDLMTHFFDVVSVDGKLYEAVGSFYLQSAAGNAKLVGDRYSWTLQELLDAKAQLQEGATIFGEGDTKSGILYSTLYNSMDDFIDWDSGTCSFDSPEMIEMLKFADQFPAEYDWENYDYENNESEYSRLSAGKQLLTRVYLSGFDEMKYINALHGGKASFVGYPSSNGKGSSFQFGGSVSITNACSDTEAAWEFVRRILTEEYQGQNGYYDGFPTNRKAFDAYVTQEMTPVYQTDPETGAILLDEQGNQIEQEQGSWYVDEDFEIKMTAMTQEEYDSFLGLYENCSTVSCYQDELVNVIEDELGPFFDGQKTAEQTAELIQNRVSLYVQEQS